MSQRVSCLLLTRMPASLVRQAGGQGMTNYQAKFTNFYRIEAEQWTL